MATGVRSPIFPLPDVTRRRWSFGHSRASGERKHAGVDMYARRGSVVIAPEAGQLVNTHRFLGPNAVALLFQTDSGPVINFGEVAPRSWEKFGLRIGSRVQAGQPLAEVGQTPRGSSMLHFEMYGPGTTQTAQWMSGRAPPSNLLDPTNYMQTAVVGGPPTNVPDTTPATDFDDDEDDDFDDADEDADDSESPEDCPPGSGMHWDPVMRICVYDPTTPPKTTTPPGPGTGPGNNGIPDEPAVCGCPPGTREIRHPDGSCECVPIVPGDNGTAPDPGEKNGGGWPWDQIGPPPMLENMSTGMAIVALLGVALLIDYGFKK
jgi:hypothetical protein